MLPLDDVLKEFLIESQENLDQLDRDLLTLERDPANRDVLAVVFRTIHTIKGTCGFFDFHRLGAVTHAGENLLSKLRDGQLTLTRDITTALLALVDAVRGMLATIPLRAISAMALRISPSRASCVSITMSTGTPVDPCPPSCTICSIETPTSPRAPARRASTPGRSCTWKRR